MSIILSLFFSISFGGDKPIKVAVIDSGYNFQTNWDAYAGKQTPYGTTVYKPKLCEGEHKDILNTNFKDDIMHGTHIVGVIAQYAQNANYCIVIIKYFDLVVGRLNVDKNYNQALLYAESIGADIINYSSRTHTFDYDEYVNVKRLLDKGITFVSAAGNEKEYIYHVVKEVSKDKEGKVKILYKNVLTNHVFTKKPLNMIYPATLDSRIISVINVGLDGKQSDSTNWGPSFNASELGENLLSPVGNGLIRMSGSSQATAVRTGKIIKERSK